MKRILPLAALTLAFTGAHPAFAQDSQFKLYAMLAYVSPLSESDQDVDGVTDAVKASDAVGYSFGGEFRASPRFGIEFDYLYAKQDVESDTAGLLGETSFQPISGTLNVHFPLGNLDIYGGPTASYVNWGDLDVASAGEDDVEIDPEFAFGISAGIDISLGPQLVATGGLRWLSLQVEPEGATEAVDVNPLFARFGLGAKF